MTQLPESVVAKLQALGGRDAVSSVMNRALRFILAGSPSDRMEMMQQALPVMDEPMADYPACDLDPSVAVSFDQYCSSKMLRAEVILTGALLQQLGEALPVGEAAPECPTVVEPGQRVDVKRRWWKFW